MGTACYKVYEEKFSLNLEDSCLLSLDTISHPGVFLALLTKLNITQLDAGFNEFEPGLETVLPHILGFRMCPIDVNSAAVGSLAT